MSGEADRVQNGSDYCFIQKPNLCICHMEMYWHVIFNVVYVDLDVSLYATQIIAYIVLTRPSCCIFCVFCWMFVCSFDLVNVGTFAVCAAFVFRSFFLFVRLFTSEWVEKLTGYRMEAIIVSSKNPICAICFINRFAEPGKQ